MDHSGRAIQDEAGSRHPADGRSESADQQAEGIKNNSWFVFSTTSGEKPFSGFSKAKRDLEYERDRQDPEDREAGADAELAAA